jgi:hypothetical protein
MIKPIEIKYLGTIVARPGARYPVSERKDKMSKRLNMTQAEYLEAIGKTPEEWEQMCIEQRKYDEGKPPTMPLHELVRELAKQELSEEDGKAMRLELLKAYNVEPHDEVRARKERERVEHENGLTKYVLVFFGIMALLVLFGIDITTFGKVLGLVGFGLFAVVFVGGLLRKMVGKS